MITARKAMSRAPGKCQKILQNTKIAISVELRILLLRLISIQYLNLIEYCYFFLDCIVKLGPLDRAR